MSAASLQLRALLAEKFPGLKTRLDEAAPAASNSWPVDLARMDETWPTSLPKGALTEVVAAGNHPGSGRLIHALLHCAAQENQIVAVIDGADSLDVSQVRETTLSRLLWIRCRSAAEVVKAADIVLRDSNFTLVLLDLKLNPEAQLRKIPATVWHRLQRLSERTSTVCVIFTPRPLVTATRVRVTLPAKIEAGLGDEADEYDQGCGIGSSGGRPSPGAAGPEGAYATRFSGDFSHAHVAAPGGGRPPGGSHIPPIRQ